MAVIKAPSLAMGAFPDFASKAGINQIELARLSTLNATWHQAICEEVIVAVRKRFKK